MICFVHDPYVWIYILLTQMASTNQVLLSGKEQCVPGVQILPITFYIIHVHKIYYQYWQWWPEHALSIYIHVHALLCL